MAENSKKTFWPYGIVLSIIACIIACIATIVISLDHPVEMDNFYLDKYQDVDTNINEILAAQRAFEDKFSVKLLNNELKLNKENEISIEILKKIDGLSDPEFKILITRPETNAHNTELNATYDGNILRSQLFTPSLLGRWQLMLKLTDTNTTGFYKFEFFASE